MSTPGAYWIAVSIGTMMCVSLCIGCRRWPGRWVGSVGRAISVVLVADGLFVSVPLAEGRWDSGRRSRSSRRPALRELEHITLARALLDQYASERTDGSDHEVTELLGRLLRAAEEGKRSGSVIEILVLQALAHQTHTRNVYAKLGVSNRRAAVSRAQEIDLLSGTPDR